MVTVHGILRHPEVEGDYNIAAKYAVPAVFISWPSALRRLFGLALEIAWHFSLSHQMLATQIEGMASTRLSVCLLGQALQSQTRVETP